MENLQTIVQGWMNYIQGSPETKQMMSVRLQICDNCSNKLRIKGSTNIYLCGQCKCPLAGKTAAPEATCPLGLWGKWKKPETYY